MRENLCDTIGSYRLFSTEHTLGPRHVCIGTKVGKILIMEDAELKTSADIIGLVDSSHIPASSVSGNDVSETSEALGIRNAEHREIHALISFKGKMVTHP